MRTNPLPTSRALLRAALLLSVVTLVIVPETHAFIELRHGRIVGSTTVRADYDSNVFVSNSQIEDLYGTIGGEVRYVRDAGVVTFDSVAGFNALGYADRSELNSIDPYLEGRIGYTPSDKTDLRGAASVRRNTLGNEQVNDRTKSNDYLFDARLQHLTTEKLGVRLVGSHTISNYLTTGYSDVLSYSLGVHGVHVYSPKLRLVAGITESEWWTTKGPAGRTRPRARDWRYSVGAEGEFGAKVSGDVSAGLVRRGINSTGFTDADALYLESRLSWMASEKTTWSLGAGQNFSVSAADQSVKSANLTLSLNQRFSEKLVLDGSVGVDRSTYVAFRGVGNRQDDGFVARGRLNYILNNYVSLEGSAGYRSNDSTASVSTFDRVNLGAAVMVRF